MGASCMRYSPSGDFLAIGCKNGSLVILAVDNRDGSDRGGRQKACIGDAPRQSGPGDSAEGQGTGQDAVRKSGSTMVPSVEISTAMAGDGTNTSKPTPPSSYGQHSQNRSKVYRRIANLRGHSSRVLHLDWTVDGRFVQTCGQDYHILHWEILPPPPNLLDEGSTEEEGTVRGHDHDGDHDHDGRHAGAVAGQFYPRMFKRAFLVRDEQWATWSSTIGWPVQVRDVCRFMPDLRPKNTDNRFHPTSRGALLLMP